MGFWKKFTGFLGFGHDLPETNTEHDDDNDTNGNNNDNSVEDVHHQNYSNLPRKGFSVSVPVPVPVPVDRAHQIGPILIPCAAGDGGVQGLGWYARGLRVDEDGDVADEFLEEIFPEQNTQFRYPKIEVKLNMKHAKARNPVLTREGTIQQYVEYKGRYLLI